MWLKNKETISHEIDSYIHRNNFCSYFVCFGTTPVYLHGTFLGTITNWIRVPINYVIVEKNVFSKGFAGARAMEYWVCTCLANGQQGF